MSLHSLSSAINTHTHTAVAQRNIVAVCIFLALPIRWWDVADDDDQQTLVSAKTAASNKIDDEWTHEINN